MWETTLDSLKAEGYIEIIEKKREWRSGQRQIAQIQVRMTPKGIAFVDAGPGQVVGDIRGRATDEPPRTRQAEEKDEGSEADDKEGKAESWRREEQMTNWQLTITLPALVLAIFGAN
jgi:hypothetical protein